MTDLRPDAIDATEPDPASGGGSRDAEVASGGKPRRLILTGAVVGAVALGLVVAVALSSWFRPHLYAGTVLQGDETAPSLAELSYADGTPVDLGAYEGEVVLVFFGYTNCPDICPTTMADAAGAVDLLDDGDAERTNLLMVSVDPDRDPVGTVEEYSSFFNPTFRGVGGPTEAIDRAASSYGVFYQLGDPEADGGYLVDHTSTLMGIDPDGTVRVVWASGIGSEALAADIEALLS